LNPLCLAPYDSTSPPGIPVTLPDFASFFDIVNGTNLNDTAQFVQDSFDTISQNATQLVEEQFSSLLFPSSSFWLARRERKTNMLI